VPGSIEPAPRCDCPSALREAALLEHHFDLVAEFTEDGRILWVSPGYSKLLGYAPHELIGRNGWQTLHPDDFATVPSLPDLRAGRAVEHEIRLRRRDGSWCPVEAVSVVYLTASGELRRIGIARDLTEEKRLDRERRRSEERYRRIAEDCGAMVFVLDPEGRFLYANQRYHDILGYSPDELLGRSAWNQTLEEDRAVLTSQFLEGLEQGRQSYRRVRVIAADGSLHWVDGSVASVPGEDGRTCAIGVFHDVTHEKTLEDEKARLAERLQQMEKLESLGVLAGGVAHDFNNLLAVISGNAELALDELSEGSAGAQAVRTIVTAVERATDLAQRMLAFSGGTALKLRRVDLNEVVEEALGLVKHEVPRNVSISFDAGRGECAVPTDRTQLIQVVSNLLLNALEALGAHPGSISIQTGTVPAGGEDPADGRATGELAPGPHVFVRIADTGPGIDPRLINRIFEPFFTTKFMGRGMGLASVLGIVRAHHGWIEVESDIGTGTAFTVRLPAMPPGAGARHA